MNLLNTPWILHWISKQNGSSPEPIPPEPQPTKSVLPDGTKFINSTFKQLPDTLDYSEITTSENMFIQCYSIEYFSGSMPKLITARSMFNGDTTLKECHLLDTELCEDFFGTFNNCSSLTSVEVNISKASNCGSMFYGCNHLVDLPELAITESNPNLQNMFKNCSRLSNTSIQNILKLLNDLVSYTNTKTLSYIGLDSTQANIAIQFPEWSTLSSNGWTTGY